MAGMIAVGGCASLPACVRGQVAIAPDREGGAADHGHAPPADLPAHGESEAIEASADAPDFAALAGFCDGVAPIAVAEYEARVEALRARMVAAEVAGVVVESGAAMQYLGGPRWRRSERPLLLVIGRSGDPVLVGSAFERHTYAGAGAELPLQIRVWQEDEDPFAIAVDAVVQAGAPARQRLATTSDSRSFVVEGLRRAAGRRGVDPISDLVDAGRRIKSAAELALLRRASEATKAAIAAATVHLRPGMLEHEFAAVVADAQRAAGLATPWVLPLFGPNAAHPHGTPEGRALHEGDLVLVDTGGFLHGYASDVTRTVPFPEVAAIDDARRRAWDTVRAAQDAALAAIRPGVRCAEVDAAARAVLAAAGYDGDYGHLSHRLGHGIGLEVHEQPYLVRGNDRHLEVGQTMSDEPGIYVPGGFGVRLEDIVAVTEDGGEVFGGRAVFA